MIYIFGDCALDTSRYTLQRAGQTIRLRPKAFRVCVYLLEHRDRVVSREDLCTQVWPEQFISQTTLEGVIRLVRRAVGDSGQTQSIIQTMHGYGYRFVAEVQECSSTSEGREAQSAAAFIETPADSALGDTKTVASADSPAQVPKVVSVPPQRGETRDNVTTRNGNRTDLSASAAHQERLPWWQQSQSIRRTAQGALALAVLTLAILGGWAFRRGLKADEFIPLGNSRIAVLPFLNLSAEEDHTYFADGMTEELIVQISQIRGLTVIARTSVMKYKGTRKDIASIGRELRVGTILEGSVRKMGNYVRISVQLVDVASQRHLWSQDYNRELTSVFGIQRDIATRVAQQLKVQLTAGGKRRVEEQGKANLEAYTLYLQGYYLRNKGTVQDLRDAIAYFERAVDKAPSYALAYAGIADAHLLLPFVAATVRPLEVYPRLMSAMEQALRHGSDFSTVHTTVASAKLWYAWDWAGAEAAFTHALTLSPDDALAHSRYTWYLITMGRINDAIAVIHRAQELNPVSAEIMSQIGLVYYFARQYDRAIAHFHTAIQMAPSFRTAYSALVYAYLQRGLHVEALGNGQEILDQWGHDPQSLWGLGYAAGISGKHDQARQALAELQERAQHTYVKPLAFAWIAISLDDREAAFAALDQAYAERDPYLTLLNADPVYDSLRQDARFTALLKKIGIAQ